MHGFVILRAKTSIGVMFAGWWNLSDAHLRQFDQREIQAAWSGSSRGSFNVCQPSTLRSVTCPLASNAQYSMRTLSAQGSMHWVLIRRRNSSLIRSIAWVVRIERHWHAGLCIPSPRRG